MNNKGQAFFVTLMIALIFLVFALAVAPSLKEFSDTARNDTTADSVGLNCTNPPDMYYQADCLFVDYFAPLFVGFLIFAAGAVIIARIII